MNFLHKNIFVKTLLYLVTFVYFLNNLRTGRASEVVDISEIDKEIEAFKSAERKEILVKQPDRCNDRELRNVQFCTGTTEYTSKGNEVEDGERCVELVDGVYISNKCVNGIWKREKMRKKNLQKKGWFRRRRRGGRSCRSWWWRRCYRPPNQRPYWQRCTPSTTSFYSPSGQTRFRITWDVPRAYDPEDGYLSVIPVRQIKYRRSYCSGFWWWRRCRTTTVYYPHYGDYFDATSYGKSYRISYKATDSRGASISCSFYIRAYIRQCYRLGFISNGRYSCTGYNSGHRCYCICNPGYTPSTSVVYCNGGSWSGSCVCQATTRCYSSNAPSFPNGRYNCPSTSVPGASCDAVCDSGYRRTKNVKIVCETSGSWYKTPWATAECSDNTSPIIYNCPQPINKISDSHMTSAVVTWTTPTATDNHDTTNPIPVQTIGNINSGDRVNAGITHSITYTATDVAGNQAKCSFTVKVTTVSCTSLSSIVNGQNSGCSHAYIYGSSCTYTCNTGYEIQGTSTLSCRIDGSWSDTVPSCKVKECPDPITVGHTFSNGRYDCPVVIPYGTSCNAVCDTGYTLDINQSLNSLIRCTVDSSNDPVFVAVGTPLCTDIHPPTFDNCDGTQKFNFEAEKGQTTAAVVYEFPTASDVVDPSPSVSRIQGPASGTIQDDSDKTYVTFRAVDDSGNNSTLCVYELSVTVIRCSPFVPPSEGSISCSLDDIHGSVCTLTCNTGYEVIGDVTSECVQDGTWSTTLVCQQIFCPGPPIDPDQGNYICPSALYPYDIVCTASCQDGFSLQQDVYTFTKCTENKNWEPNVEAVCVDVEPPVIQNCESSLTFVADKRSRSTNVTWDIPTATDNFDPSPNVYQIDGPAWGSLLEGEATIKHRANDSAGVNSDVCVTQLNVEVTECVFPAWPEFGEYSCDLDNIYGSICTYSCQIGYELSASETVECLSDGNWSYGSTQPSCNIISCGPPEVREHGEFECLDNMHTYQSTCTLKCDVGFSSVTTVRSECQADKTWSYTSSENCTDATPPVFTTCDSYQTFYAEKSSNGTTPTWVLPDASDNLDNSDDIVITQLSGPESGDFVGVGETVVSYTAYDTQGNQAVEECNITLNVEEIFCDEPNITFTDENLAFECENYKYGVNCTVDCPSVNYGLNGSSWIECEANFSNGIPSAYWSYNGDISPYCFEEKCPHSFPQPTNGAVAYTEGSNDGFAIAALTCNTNYDVALGVDGISLCKTVNGSSYWDPDSFPGCTRRKRPQLNLLKTGFYYTGDCSSEATQNEIKDFVWSLNGTYVDTVFEFHTVHVDCPLVVKRSLSDRRKRSMATIEVNITIVYRMEINVYDDLFTADEVLLGMADVLRELVENGTFDIPALGLTVDPTTFTHDDYSNPFCEGGSVEFDGNEAKCIVCAAGQFLTTVDGQNICEDCPVGQYSSPGQTECTSCPTGFSTLSTSSESIDNCTSFCPSGQVSSSRIEPCTPCPVNTYQSSTGQTTCSACPKEKRTFKTGSANCSYYDIRLEAGDYNRLIYSTESSFTDVAFGFWFKKAKDDDLRFILKHSTGIQIGFVNLGSQLTLNDGIEDTTAALPEGNQWSHLVVSQGTTIDVYLNGSSIISKARAASSVTLGTQLILEVSSQSDIRISGFGIFDKALDIIAVAEMYSSCVLGTELPLFGSDDILSLGLEEISAKPSTCTPDDVCLVNPCNGHLCMPKTEGFACSCNNGYSGEYCSIEPDNCYNNDNCSNGGTCVNSDIGYTCTCQNGYTGRHCQTPPVDGKWSAWSSWTACTVTCDGGTQTRTRTCTNPAPSLYGANCVGEPSETKDCNTVTCQELHPCLSSPCGDSSTCIEADFGFLCVCKAGYTGALCDKQINYCQGDTCKNGATCMSGTTGYTCTCISRYTGTHCETEIPDPFYWTAWSSCTAECGGGSSNRTKICVSTSASSACVSTTETKDCGTTPCLDDHCTSSPCGNTHTCINEESEFKCVCSDGYTGTTCSETIDHCTDVECGDGTCQNSLTGYTCLCPTGYSGDECTIPPVDGQWTDWSEWNDCSITCGSGVTSRTRTCTNPTPGEGGAPCDGEGLEEKSCTVDCSDACNSNPCVNGECAVTANGVVCHCNDGYTGAACDASIDPCDPDPCSNGGVCEANSTDYTCSCVGGYTGDDCGIAPESSAWDNWGEWSECSVSCGPDGTQTRERTCLEVAVDDGCNGDATEVLVCNNDTDCPECSDLPRRFGVLFDCEDPVVNDTRICTVRCKSDDYVFANATFVAPDQYICGPDTGYNWNHNLTIIPECNRAVRGRGITVGTRVSTTSAVSCDKVSQTEDHFQNELSESACGEDPNCQISVTVSGCTNRRRRNDGFGIYKRDAGATSTVEFEFTYNTTQNETEDGDSEMAVIALEDTMLLIENGTEEFLTTTIDGEIITLDNSNMSVAPSIDCPVGYIPEEIYCVGCAPGTYYNTSLSACTECEQGTYQNLTGQLSCVSCGEGYITNYTRSTNESDCIWIPPEAYQYMPTETPPEIHPVENEESSTPVALIGGAVGGALALVVIVIVIIAIVCWIKHKQQRKVANSQERSHNRQRQATLAQPPFFHTNFAENGPKNLVFDRSRTPLRLLRDDSSTSLASNYSTRTVNGISLREETDVDLY